MVAAGVGSALPGEEPGTEAEALDAIKMTLALGADVNAVDATGNTAMHGAAYKHLPAVVRFLGTAGAPGRDLEPAEQGRLHAAADRRRHSARHELRLLARDRGRDPRICSEPAETTGTAARR